MSPKIRALTVTSAGMPTPTLLEEIYAFCFIYRPPTFHSVSRAFKNKLNIANKDTFLACLLSVVITCRGFARLKITLIRLINSPYTGKQVLAAY